MSGKTSKKQKSKRRARQAKRRSGTPVRGQKTAAHCVISRSESGMLSDLLKPAPVAETYDTALIDQKIDQRFGQKFRRSATAGSSFSIAAGVAATTMAGILSHLR